jgi:hypothetical protein
VSGELVYPYPVRVLRFEIAIWNVTFLSVTTLAYLIFARSFRVRDDGCRPRFLFARWVVIVYLASIAAQFFAYVMDRNTTVLPSASISAISYYFNPLFGPKTLYGVILGVPVIVGITIAPPWRRSDYRKGLDTPQRCNPISVIWSSLRS